ncbi:hypothetical protein BGW41_001310 [Actinomortierella wolfii]|nr:hypothetical protein BGW41_001310 [Actinomortierella wolfii]
MATPTNTGSISSTAASGERPSELPSWATGDPFFDTMAGMDPEEYNALYKQGQTNGAGQTDGLSIENKMATLSTAAEGEDGEGKAVQMDQDPNVGLAYWNKRREEWTGGKWNKVESENRDNPLLKVFEVTSKHVAIYDSLVYEKRRLHKPIPLPLVVSVLVSGWKSEGLWQEAAAQSAAQASTSQAGNAQVPGFCSTNSQPAKK